MKYHELTVAPTKNKKRVGRGISAGQGKTAGRGTKGQGSRTGKKLSATFMGGQGTLVQRIPKKKGFRSLRVPAQVVYVDMLNEATGSKITNVTLFEQGFITTPYHTVKIIARGEYKGKATIAVQAASKGAQAAITKGGGTFEKTPVPTLPKSQRKTDA